MVDFHFYQAKKSPHEKGVNVSSTFKRFFPLFVLAALLPIFVGLVRRPTDVKLDSQASSNDLTVWIEPANVSVSYNKTIKLTVKAFFDNDSTFMPGVKVPLAITGPGALQTATVSYGKPFKGQVVLGEVTVIPQRAGTIHVSIDPKSVVSDAFSESFVVNVSSADIEVH